MSQNLNPVVFWAQTETRVSLKVDLKDVKSATVLFTSQELNYASAGIGAKGQNEYEFTLPLYETIDTDRCSYKVSANRVDIVLEKSVAEWWPRLQNRPQKPHWLKIDFDKWRPSKEDEDAFDDEREHRDQDRARELMQDYPDIMGQVEQEELGYRRENYKKVYLLFYNLIQFIGYLYIVLVMGIQYLKRGPDFIPETFIYVGDAMKFFQLLQFLEVMHSMFGYTKNSMLVPFMQTTGRGFILFIMIDAEERMQPKPVVFYLFLVWSIIEVIRYPYYFLNLVLDNRGKMAFYFRWIMWLRYSIWIPLYPLGVLCEGLVIIRNIVYFEETGRFSVDMPNKFNFTWDMVLFLKMYLLFLIIPGIFFMMRHMSKERAKRLNPKKHFD